ncbi:MAG: hypothetical protein JRF31_00515 [Deltaproteobacteria bacterium]|nr:hypothetical protein [Deltaproteobacteria bacterium]
MLKEEEILLKIFQDSEGKRKLTLRDVMKQLRAKSGKFSETEAILHMMEALIVESTKRRGW